MEWIKLIVVLIFIASWIVGNLREQQKARQQAGPPPLPPPQPEPGGPARPRDDLQDFLRQVRRRMGEPEPRPQTIDEPLKTILVEDAPRLPPPRREEPPKLKKRKKYQADTAPNLARRTAEVTSLIPDPVKFGAAAASDPVPMVSRPRQASRAALDVVALLKSPAGVPTAFLLKEILDAPLSKRRGRR